MGPGLPRKLGVVEQVRLSKVLGSIVDYRLNRNGFAEIDLFLTEREHRAVHALGATPAAPVPISSSMLGPGQAPLFHAIVKHLEHGIAGKCDVLLYSTFQLEHALMPKLVFARPELSAHVFLLGDAGVSLPFFRGMASLARCAHSLAHVHADLAARAEQPEPDASASARFADRSSPVLVGARPLPGKILEARPTIHRGRSATVLLHRWLGRYGVHVVAPNEDGSLRSLRSLAPVRRAEALAELDAQITVERRYDREAAAIVRRETAVVRMRARLIRLTRELARVSALLPFPIQSWLLRAPELERDRDHATPLLALNVVLAAAAALVALAVPASSLPWAALLSFPIEIVGGVAYHASLSLESGPHRWVRRVWQSQIAVLFFAGLTLALRAPSITLASLWPSSAWLVLAGAFVIGLYGFEGATRRALARAELDS